MNITRAVSDVKTFRSVTRFKDRKAFTGNFYHLYPVFTRWCNPNDIWRSTCNAFIRLQPMLAPPLTENNLRVRWFFVSLRQIEPDLTPLIITGSNDGKLSEETLPIFPSIWDFADKYNANNDDVVISANSIAHILFNIPVGNYDTADVAILNQSKSSPRMYWLKAFFRICWDYYRDENLGFEFVTNMADYDSFDEWWSSIQYVESGSDKNLSPYLTAKCPSVLLKKDYFTSASPWILKGAQPSIQMQILGNALTWNPLEKASSGLGTFAGNGYGISAGSAITSLELPSSLSDAQANNVNKNMQKYLDNIDVNSLGLSFNMSDWRDMKAQTKVLERLARTGSRYTEFLRANFNIAPADETLQRAVYLGGFKQNILTNEVLQTAADGDNPVGTMRGHGISFGTNSMHSYLCKEFGMLFALADVRPNLVYTQGVNREFTYGSRYDFMNPSFQHLSEQGIRKGELFYGADVDSAGKPKNDEVLGFTGMYNEMRTGKEVMCGEFGAGGSMSFWNQAISFASRPSLSFGLLKGTNYNADSQRPFGINDDSSNPILFDFVFNNSPARQLTKNPVPLP